MIAAPHSIWFPDAPVFHSIHGEGTRSGQTPLPTPDGLLSKSVPPELMNTSGDGIPHSHLDSLSHDLSAISKGGLLHEPGSNALVRIIITSCLSAVDPKVMAMSVSGDVPDKLPIPIVINMEVKAQLKKEIREFGGRK